MYGICPRYGWAAIDKPYKKNYGLRKISSNLFKFVKGCFVCGKERKAITLYLRLEIREAIDKLKQRNPSAMIAIDDLVYISNELCENDNKSDDGLVYKNDIEHNESDSYGVKDQNKSIKLEEQRLSNNSFIHGSSFNLDYDKNIKFMNLARTTESIPKFRGIRLYTCCNNSLFMS